MQRVDEDRQHRVRLLSKSLEEVATKRCALLRELQDLDDHERILQKELDALHNLDAPIAILPDEVLALVFEEGRHLQDRPVHFGIIASHVIRRWRTVALSTPRLWTSIRCIVPEDGSATDLNELLGRLATLFFRANSSPLELYLEGDFSLDHNTALLQLVVDHIGPCHRLHIEGCGGEQGLRRVLSCISSKAMPLLSWMYLSCGFVRFTEPIFSSGTPRLTNVQLHSLNFRSMPLCLPAFESVTSLRLTGVIIKSESVYNAFRDGLMSLRRLLHLELCPYYFHSPPTRLPIALPDILFLHIDANKCPQDLDDIISSIHATSLATLSLMVWGSVADGYFKAEPHFPSLQNLILTNVTDEAPSFNLLARTFPDIKKLTFQASDQAKYEPFLHNIDFVLDAILYGTGIDDRLEGGGMHTIGLSWPKLQILAVSTPNNPRADARKIHTMIVQSRVAGCLVSKLMLPSKVFSWDSAEAVLELKGTIEIVDFELDWPTPFEQGPS